MKYVMRFSLGGKANKKTFSVAQFEQPLTLQRFHCGRSIIHLLFIYCLSKVLINLARAQPRDFQLF